MKNESINISIRLTELSDIPVICRIETQSGGSWKESTLREELQKSDTLFMVALNNEKVLGSVLARVIVDEIEIFALAVDPDARRMGVATRLMDEIKKAGHKSSCRKIHLEVREKNITAQSFYQNYGFSISGKRKNYYKDDNALIMTMELQ